ncbi:MAG: hypothetical protein QXQ29_03355 [Candidatus Bathyarchaeia archaeon]
MSVTALLIQIIVCILFIAPILWISGRILVGKDKAKFTDAIWIVILGVILGSIINYFIHGLLATILVIIVWLLLTKHFFDCGWLKALAISILAAIIFILIIVILVTIGIGILIL